MKKNRKRDSVIRVFDSLAEEYVKYFGDDWEFLNEIKDFTKRLEVNSTVLDLGCGSGYITNYLCSQDLNAIGIDFSEEMIKIAKRKYPKVEFLSADFTSLENYFEKDQVDGLIAIYSLYFVPKEQFKDMLQVLSRILKNKGLFLFVTEIGTGEDYVTTPLMDDNNIKEKLYVNYYRKEELEDILNENHFDIEYFRTKKSQDEKEITEGRYIILARNNKKEGE